MRRPKRHGLTTLLGAAVFVMSATSSGATPPAPAQRLDGAYGRFDGDLTFELGAGAAAYTRRPQPAAEAALLFLGTAGLRAATQLPTGSQAFSTSGGFTVRPIFLTRFFHDKERGPASWDLLVDSMRLDVGAYLRAAQQPTASALREGHKGLELGLGAALPLNQHAQGLFLQFGVALQLGRLSRDPDSATRTLLTMSLAWHEVFASGLFARTAPNVVAPRP